MNKITVRHFVFQLILVALIIGLFAVIWQNTAVNMAHRHLDLSFTFLENPAGFAISQHVIPYHEGDDYARVFVVGLLNTLLISALSILTATFCGTFMGIMRVSHNFLLRKLAGIYVEVFRNIPLLLQIFFWYFAVLSLLPPPRQSQLKWGCGEDGCLAVLNNRGLSLISPQWTGVTKICLGFFILMLGLVVFLIWKNQKTRQKTGKTQSWLWLINLNLLLSPLALWLMLANGADVQLPKLQGFNYQGGMTLLPELIALWVALTLYSAAYMAEYVRSGIESVPRGQYEAATALGLSTRKMMRLIILPQALRVIIPPMTSQYLNIVKNSSLATAIAYPDLVSVFMGTALNQTGRAVEIISITMAVYLLMSLLISLLMNIYNHQIKLTER